MMIISRTTTTNTLHSPPISTPEEALDLLNIASERCGYKGRVHYAIDPASSEFFSSSSGEYNLGMKMDTPKQLKASELASLYKKLLAEYPIILLEDPFAQDDWPAWTEFNKDCPVELVGDDLLATNLDRINMAIEKRACNSLLLKINQIGTISESIAA